MTPDYQTDDGRVVMYCADCLDVLREMPDGCVDAVVTDPPCANGDQTLVTFDSVDAAFITTVFDDLTNRIAKRWVLATVEWRHVKALEDADLLVRFGVWIKPNGAPQFTVAICHREGKKRWNGGGRHAVWNIPKTEGEHPTQKPMRIILELVTVFSDPQETILDPFMGSGTTGVACIQTGRRFIGIEKEPKYFDIAVQRIETALEQAKQMPLFAEPAAKPVQESLL